MIVRIATVSAHYERDMAFCRDKILRQIALARRRDIDLLVLPEAALGGYLGELPESIGPPPLDLDGPELRELIMAAGDTVVCLGFCEAALSPNGSASVGRYNTAVCLSGDGVHGVHRKVHQPLTSEHGFAAGTGFTAFDTPVGRMGMMISDDKAFPEAARTLALDGAEVIACLSAWPAGRSDPISDLASDRLTRRFDIYDQARALENQVVWVSASQTGRHGPVRFIGRAKIVDPSGFVVAETDCGPGVALAEIDVPGVVGTARAATCHLADRRPAAYQLAVQA